MNHPLSFWADVVAELANRRLPLWRDRLSRSDVEYKREELGMLAMMIHKAGAVMDQHGAIDMAERGFLRLELPWHIEWHSKRHGGGRA